MSERETEIETENKIKEQHRIQQADDLIEMQSLLTEAVKETKKELE